MIIVGELINASRKAVGEAIRTGDESAIAQLAQNQMDSGADFIDVNAGIFEDREAEYLRGLVQTVQKTVDVPCCIGQSGSRGH